MSSNKEQQSSTSKQSTTSSNSMALSQKQSAANNKRCQAKSHPSAAEDTRFDVITMPHDGYFRVNLEEPKVRNTFLKRFLPKYFQQICNIEASALELNHHVGDALEQTVSDVVLSIPTTDGYKVFTLIEHQSSADKNIVWRMYEYMNAIIKRHHKQQGTRPHVVPILFYQGDGKPYSGTLNVQEEFMPKIMSPTITSRDLVVVDLAPMSDDEIMGCDNLAAMMLAMKYVRKPDDFNKVMDKMIIALSRLPSDLQGKTLIYINNQWDYAKQELERAMHERQILSEGKMSNLIDVLRKEIREHDLKQYEQKLQQSEQKLQQSEQKLQQSEQKIQQSEQKIQQYEQELQQSKLEQQQSQQEHQVLLHLFNSYLAEGKVAKDIKERTGLSLQRIQQLIAEAKSLPKLN